MTDYISREAAIALAREGRLVSNSNFKSVCDAINSIPAADVRPVVRGKWIEFPAALAYKDAYCDTHIVCSACEAVFDIMDNDTERFNFCPNCGARMEES